MDKWHVVYVRADMAALRQSGGYGLPAAVLTCAARRAWCRPLRGSVAATHDVSRPDDAAVEALRDDAFGPVSIDAPWVEVDTTAGYEPGRETIVGVLGPDLAQAGAGRYLSPSFRITVGGVPFAFT
jgi:hypothetical protein